MPRTSPPPRTPRSSTRCWTAASTCRRPRSRLGSCPPPTTTRPLSGSRARPRLRRALPRRRLAPNTTSLDRYRFGTSCHPLPCQDWRCTAGAAACAGTRRAGSMAIRNVISTLSADGTEVMGPGVLMYHYPGNDIMNGSLLTVESNHFCVLKSRGAILNVYETGQYPVETPQRPLIGSMQQAFYGGQSPWQYEALFVSRAKSVVNTKGLALSRELAEMVYDVDYYVHVDNPQDAVKLVTHMPYAGHVLTVDALNAYAGPVVEQSVNQIVQLTPLEHVNERIHDITELVRGH